MLFDNLAFKRTKKFKLHISVAAKWLEAAMLFPLNNDETFFMTISSVDFGAYKHHNKMLFSYIVHNI